jgi:hypothetical protein
VHPIVRLREDGPDYGITPKPGDEIGYCMDPWRQDDCLAAAMATVLQQPIEQVPDLRLDGRLSAGEDADEIARRSWERINEWLERLGLQVVFHESPPLDRDRWIGVCGPSEKTFGDHCLVMSHDRLVLDPSISVARPPGETWCSFDPSHIYYGISFDREEQ